MFRVKSKKNEKIYQVLATCVEDLFGATFFLIWENDGWRWRPADNFVPPNFEVKDVKTN